MPKLFKPANKKKVTDTDSPSGVAVGPHHIAIIMDGNGRWARRRGLPTRAGHQAGVEAVRAVLQACLDNHVDTLTLFAFSSENWQRPRAEVQALMRLLSVYLKKEVAKLNRDGIRLRFIGARDKFGSSLLKQIEQAEACTALNRRATLVLAVDYGGKWDIVQAARQLAEEVASGELRSDQVTAANLNSRLQAADLPAPDLCIRTAGEQRISNFMLWQLAYAEYYFTDVLWPDFGEADFARAIQVYRDRERRFGRRDDELSPEERTDDTVRQPGVF